MTVVFLFLWLVLACTAESDSLTHMLPLAVYIPLSPIAWPPTDLLLRLIHCLPCSTSFYLHPTQNRVYLP